MSADNADLGTWVLLTCGCETPLGIPCGEHTPNALFNSAGMPRAHDGLPPSPRAKNLRLKVEDTDA